MLHIVASADTENFYKYNLEGPKKVFDLNRSSLEKE
jgi:hypothetical protein